MITPIFIVGAPRSGTTLVQCILSANSHIFSLPETHFFIILRSLGRSATDYLTVADLSNINHIIVSKSGICIPKSTYQDLYEHAETRTLLALSVFETIVELYRPKNDKSRQLLVVEKTPSHYLSLMQISSVYPTAKFINVVRNPLDVINSLSKPPFSSISFVLARARLWNHALDCVHRFQKNSTEKLLSIRYEDIIIDAECTVKQICDWLEIPYEVKMLTDFGREFETNTATNEYWKQNVKSGQLLDRRGKWREKLTEGNGWLIEKITRDNRKRYGYHAQAFPSIPEILKTSILLGFSGINHYSARITSSSRR